MLRCALLLSLITMLSVVGQPGVLPFSPGLTKGSLVVDICAARQRCVDVVGGSTHEAEAIFEVSPAAKATLVLATRAYGLPVPNSATKKSTCTVSAKTGLFLEIRANAKFVALFCGS